MPQNEPDKTSRLKYILEQVPGRQRPLKLLWIILIATVLVGVVVYSLLPRSEATLSYKTAEVHRGDLTVQVTATGVLQPVNQVEVGTEVSGTIESVEVDFNSRVKRGQVMARLDTERLKAQVIQSRASLQSAEARVEEAKATVLETRVRRDRCAKLAKKQLCSQDDLDTLSAAYSRAMAAETSARAQVAVAKATLDAHDTDLGKAVIRAPIDGIVLKRQIEPGQTVAASLQTPVLFVLAESLAQMELHVAIDEADVGHVKEGQQASFSVDAYPQRIFPAVISQVRFAPQTVEGVVTYETVLTVDNSDLLLRPGMTATAEIITKQLNDVLLVPNVALRFVPPTTSKAKRENGGSLFSRLFPRPRHSTDAKAKLSSQQEQRVWILGEGAPVAVPVQVGASDGKLTEVTGGKLVAGEPVIIDVSGKR
jgi:HlyD family secretion protein